MMTTKFETDETRPVPEQLRYARETLALSAEDVAANLGVPVEDVLDWESGTRQPTVEQLCDLADFYERDLDFFLSPRPRPPDELSFRSAARQAVARLSLEARKIVARFEELCRAATELDALVEASREVRVERYYELEPEVAAARERQRLRLDGKPIPDVRKLVETLGVRVFQLSVVNDEFSGLSCWYPEYGPCMVINAHDSPGRRTFTIAHEYAHLLRPGGPAVCTIYPEVGEEQFANRFAAAFLMPASDVQEQFTLRGLDPESINVNQVRSFAWRYRVSPEALLRRLAGLALISRELAAYLIERLQASPEYRRRPKAPTWRRQLGDHYVDNAIKAHRDGRISIGKLAKYLGLDIRKAIEVARGEATDQPSGE